MYTKGEWHVGHMLDANFHAQLRVITCDDYQNGGFPFICYVNDVPKEQEANAQLIAAAPDLYEALKWVTKMASHSEGDSKVILMAEKALAKVEKLDKTD